MNVLFCHGLESGLMRLEPAARTIVVHGTRDEVVPIVASRTFANGREDVTLLEVDDDHSLAGSIEVIVQISPGCTHEFIRTQATLRTCPSALTGGLGTARCRLEDRVRFSYTCSFFVQRSPVDHPKTAPIQ